MDGKERGVPCRFEVRGDTVSFAFPEGYDEDHPLVIDPDVVFASYSGSSADNWGNTATYDNAGNFYGGSTVFGAGFPSTSGAFQEDFAGGAAIGSPCDISLKKFSADGSQLLYATYLGGSSNEVPTSLITNDQGELYMLGVTGSQDYPTNNAYQSNFQGGTNTNFFGSIWFLNGTDIVISKLSADGTALPNSTYFGGTQNDGTNEADNLNVNYGDILRGELILKDQEVVVTSSTYSDNLATSGAAQTSIQGGQDAIVLGMSTDLSTLNWATYLGGSSDDAGYAIRKFDNGDFYITGGTDGSSLPAMNGWKTTPQGDVDGYVLRMSPDGSTFIDGSYAATTAYDQSYLIEEDTSGHLFLYGQSTGTYPVKNAGYSNPNSGQFIQKFPPDLDSNEMSTVFGTGSGEIDISPTALRVNKCNNISLTGWGGSTNNVPSSTTNGLPTTNNAFQSSTDGSDFYLMVLGGDASSLIYGSFFGGGTSAEHVDGGTSRFDDDGIIYQAVCGGCGGNSDFPTTNGAYSETNNSTNCNFAAIKFDLDPVTSTIGVKGQPNAQPLSCAGDTMTFYTDTSESSYMEWDLGDTLIEGYNKDTVKKVFEDTGTYEVTLVVSDSVFCVDDTSRITIQVGAPFAAAINTEDDDCWAQCNGRAVVDPDGKAPHTYTWSNGIAGPNDSVANDVCAGSYELKIEDAFGCTLDTSFTIGEPDDDTLKASADAVNSPLLCDGDSGRIDLEVNGGTPPYSYNWSTGDTVQDIDSLSPGSYWVEVVDANGCVDSAQAAITVQDHPPLNAFGLRDTTVCRDQRSRIGVEASGGTGNYKYDWEGPYIDSEEGSDLIIIPRDAGTYRVVVSDACGNRDSTSGFVKTQVCELNVPNIITPNPKKDTLNQEFVIGNLENFPGSRLEIFDKWGNLIYESDDYKNDWDGGGHSEGTYFFILKPNAESMDDITGTVTILKGEQAN